MVGQHLKQADKFLLQHNFDEAEREVAKALELEPTNIYARAYRERIRTLKEEYFKKKIEEEEQRRAVEHITEMTVAKEHPKEPSPPPPSVGHAAPSPPKIPTPDVVEQYRMKLYECWRDGSLTPQEQAMLDQERKALGISDVQHEQLQNDVKLTCYVDAVKQASRSWTISPLKSNALEQLRKQFDVTVEEHLAVEGRIVWELQHPHHNATIMMIDDEEDLLSVVGEGLESHGYNVITAQSPEEALQLLSKTVPDMILCDIWFPGSTLDGFAIYKKTRSLRQLVTIPFVFMTGVKDEWVLHQGLEIGADDYLTKPFTMTTILSVIEGKLLRYEELKRAFRAS